MWISQYLLKLAKALLIGGIPVWFIGLIITASVATSVDANEFEVAFAEFLTSGGWIAIVAGLAALVVGAAIVDHREGRPRRARARTTR